VSALINAYPAPHLLRIAQFGLDCDDPALYDAGSSVLSFLVLHLRVPICMVPPELVARTEMLELAWRAHFGSGMADGGANGLSST